MSARSGGRIGFAFMLQVIASKMGEIQRNYLDLHIIIFIIMIIIAEIRI